MTLSAIEKQRLDEDGYLILEDFVDAGLLARLRDRIEELFRAEGESTGQEFRLEPGCRRLANLVDKGDVFRKIIVLPRRRPGRWWEWCTPRSPSASIWSPLRKSSSRRQPSP